MKGPIAAALGAVSAIRRSGVRLGGRLDLHLVADEELAGLHGTKVLLERGDLDQDAAIVGEPTELNLALAERGGLDHRHRPRDGGPRLDAAPRRERDHVDGAVPAPHRGGPPSTSSIRSSGDRR